MKRIKPTIIACALLSSLSAPAFAALGEQATLSRYVKIEITPDVQQKKPLQTLVSISFPPAIKTISQAMNYALEETGYELLDIAKTHNAARVMYQLKLPKVHRRFEHTTVAALLETLASDAFVMVGDPIRREISFLPVVEYSNAQQ